MNSKKNKRSQTVEQFSENELGIIFSSLICYSHIADEASDDILAITKKVERSIRDKACIQNSLHDAQDLLEAFALSHYEEGRDYQYSHDHRWDWKNRYIEVAPEMEELLIESWQKRKTIWMEYASVDDAEAGRRITKREVDIYNIDGGYFSGFCHLRKEQRTFRMDRIISIRPTKKIFTIPNNVMQLPIK